MVEFEFVRITEIFLDRECVTDSVVVVVVLVAIVDTIMPYYLLVGQNFESQFFFQKALCIK